MSKKEWNPPIIKKYLNVDEIKKLLAATKEKDTIDKARGRKTWRKRYTLLKIAFSAGLRVSEICNLKIKHLFLESITPSIFIENDMRKLSRKVLINEDLKQHLIKFVHTTKRLLEEKTEPEDFLFCSAKGNQLSIRALQIGFKACLENAGFDPELSISIARQSCANNLCTTTADLRFVQSQLGHATLDTLNPYNQEDTQNGFVRPVNTTITELIKSEEVSVLQRLEVELNEEDIDYQLIEFLSTRQLSLLKMLQTEETDNSINKNVLPNPYKQLHDRYSLSNYKQVVTLITNQNFKKYYNYINPKNLPRGYNKYHIDHIFTIINGFSSKISPEVLASPINLQMLPAKENRIKQGRSDMTEEMLYELYNQFEREVKETKI